MTPTPETKAIVLILLLSIGVNLFFAYENFSGEIKNFIPSVSVNIISSIITFIAIVVFYKYTQKVNRQEELNKIKILKIEIENIPLVDKKEEQRHIKLLSELDFISETIRKKEEEILDMSVREILDMSVREIQMNNLMFKKGV